MDCEDCQNSLGLVKTALVAVATSWCISGVLTLLANASERRMDARRPAEYGSCSESGSEDEGEDEDEDEGKCQYAELFPIEEADHDVSAELEQAFSVWTGTNPNAPAAIVCYSADQTAFLYWCNTTMPWPALEAMSRQYVTEHRCRDLYVTPGTVAVAAADTAATAEISEAANDEEAPSVMTKPSNNYMRMGRLKAYRTRTTDAGRDEHLTYGRFKVMSGTGHFSSGGR